MFYGCVGVVGGGVRDTVWSWCCLVALKQEKGAGGLEGLAFLDEAGMIFLLCFLESSIESEGRLSTRLPHVKYNRTSHTVGLLTFFVQVLIFYICFRLSS